MSEHNKPWIVKHIVWILMVLFFVTTSIHSTSSLDNDRIQRLDNYIDATLSSLNIPAASIAISKGEQMIYHRNFGEDVTITTRFYIGSITKTFTGLAIAQLLDTGDIDINQSVSTYIPEFRVSDDITVKHLLHHMSGMQESEYNSFGALNPTASFMDLVHDMNDMQLTYTPGTTFAYFNAGYSLLGLIIENVSGLSYVDYMKNHVFNPLGLNNVSLIGDVDVQGHLSWFGFPLRRAEPFVTYDLPGGFMSSSSQDLLTFLDAIRLRDPRLGLSPQGFETFLQVNEVNGFYSMGLMHYPLANRPAIHHGGSLPGFLANGIILPEEDISIAIVLNKNHVLLATVFQPDLSEGIIRILNHQESPTRFQLFWLFRALLLVVLLVIGLNVRKFIQMLKRPQQLSVKQRMRSIIVNGVIVLGLVLSMPWIGSVLFPQRGFDMRLAFMLMPDLISFLFIGLSMHVIEIGIHVWILSTQHQISYKNKLID